MVGVGVAEGASPGGGAPGPEPYYGEYYQPEQYFVPQEMCPHPQQHPQHAHMCTVHPDYGGMPVVTSGTMMPGMMPPAVLDENMRFHLVHAHHPHHHPPPHHQHPQHHQQQHHPPQHHQPPHHFAPTNGASGGQHFYNTGYPPHFHLAPHHMQHSPPPPVYQKDERTQKQYSKLKQKLERKHNSRTNGIELISGGSTPSLSPRKEVNGSGGGSGGASSGAWSEGEGSSASASTHGDEDQDSQALLDMLSSVRTPQVSEVTPNTALVQWNSPLPEGVPLPRSELTYELLLGDRGRGRYKAIYRGTSLTCRVRDLRPGCEYSVRLQVRAGELTGAASEALTFIAPAAPPEKMAQPRVTQRTRTSVLLRWGAAGDNGARLSHYVLEMDGGTGFVEVARPRSKQHTANDLQPQTLYRFRIAAVNERGRGEWSPEAAVWTLGAPPPAPAPPRLLDADTASLALGWERRAPDDEFTLQMDDRALGHGYLPVYAGPEERHVCTGLRRATEYSFRLRAETADGQGPWSPEVTYRTLCERPAAPGRPALRGKLHSRAFRLRWDPPADDGGAPVQTYTLQLDDGQGYTEAYYGPDREAHCEHLQPGTTYSARVNCANEAGSSEWSTTETITTEAQCPGACEGAELVGKCRPTSAQLRWRPPACTGGAPVTQYRAEVTGKDGSPRNAYCGPAPECTLRDLTPGEEYTVTVVAVNRVGPGPPTPAVRVVAAPAPPGPPPAPTAGPLSAHTAHLSWDPPQDNGAPLLDYRLQVATADRDDAYQDVFLGLDTRHTVDGLTPFTAYFFRVCASNCAGRGPWSATRDLVTDRAPPAAPATPRCESATHSLTLGWSPPADHGAPLLRYLVSLDDRTHMTEELTHTVEELQPNTEYCVRVAAENELGVGAWSDPLLARTRPPPPPPPPLTCTQRAHNYLKLQWGDTVTDESVQYRLEMRAPDSREFRPVYRGSAKFYKVKKLREATAYEFRIRASDDRGGRGDVSAPMEARTLEAPPVAPRAPTLEAVGGGRVGVQWDGGDEHTYVVQVWAGGEWRDAWSGAGATCVVEAEGAEVAVRVVAARGVSSAPSPPSRLSAPPAPAAPRPRRRAPRPLPAGRVALLVAGALAVLAVLVAVVLQRLVDPAP